MKNRISIIGLFLTSLLGQAVWGQNLVPNPDFSMMDACDTTNFHLGIEFTDWYEAPQKSPLHNSFTESTHYCKPINVYGVPPTFGYSRQGCLTIPFPKAGLGYPMLWVEDDTTFNTYNTLIQAKLKRALTAQDTYHLSFYVAFQKLNVDYIKSYGMALSRDTITKADIAAVTPQVSTTEWYHDTLWNRFDTTYIAQGGERFVTLGNFWPCNDAYERDNPNTPVAPCNHSSENFIFLDAVSVYPLSQTRFQIDLPEDTTLCGGDTLLLDPVIRGGIPDDTATTYRWSTGSTDSVLRVTQPGTYWVEVTMNAQFSESDTFRVKGIPALPLVQKPDTLLCPGDSIAFTLPQDTFYTATWRDGFPGLQRWLIADSVYPYQLASACDTQRRSLRIIALICDSVPVDTVKVPEDTIRISDYNLIIPDAFTPNGDGLNEVWDIPGLPPGSRVEVYTRWGERLFFADPYEQPWDGTDRQGKPLPSGTYVYSILHTVDGQGRKRINGVVNIVR